MPFLFLRPQDLKAILGIGFKIPSEKNGKTVKHPEQTTEFWLKKSAQELLDLEKKIAEPSKDE